jgi:hypothetical protein
MQAELIRSYEELCDHARERAAVGDDALWDVGDDACEVETSYGEHNLDDFARNIGKPKGSVREYRQMSKFWTKSERAEILGDCPNVTRSHMRKAMPLKDPVKARWAVEKCSERGWTVDQFGYILHRYRRLKGDAVTKPVPPVRTSFAAAGWNANRGDFASVFLTANDSTAFCAATNHEGATVTVLVEYPAEVQA